MIRAISGLAIGTYTVGTVGSEAVGAYMVRTVGSEAAGAYMVRTVSSDTSDVSVRRAVFCNYRSMNGVRRINGGKCKGAACENRKSEAEDQFVSFHGSCSRST
jgi:hypothetical protein